MEQYIGLDVSLKETSLCVYQTGTTLAVADTILWPAARGSGVMEKGSEAVRRVGSPSYRHDLRGNRGTLHVSHRRRVKGGIRSRAETSPSSFGDRFTSASAAGRATFSPTIVNVIAAERLYYFAQDRGQETWNIVQAHRPRP